jgi:hypothetical protein
MSLMKYLGGSRLDIARGVLSASRRAVPRCVVALMTLVAPAALFAQAQAPTTINISGGAQGANQTVPTGETRFGLRVPLKPNAENVLSLVATDTDGRTTKVDELRIAQISLTEIVQARVTAERLSTAEVRQLVAEGVINLADPANYNVSRFVVALVVGGQEVRVPVPVVRHREETFGEGPPISIGCAAPGRGLSTTDRSISIPCGGGGGGGGQAQIQIVPFEVAPAVEGMPGIPGVIIIEGRIKTLKEFFKVNLLLMNVSSLFTLTELTARLEVPEGALTPVAPAGASIALPDIGPASETTGQFIVRGDTKGIHTVTAHFGGKINGSFLPEPVAFSGNASTDLEVKGPPQLDVKVTHPDFVTAGQPYDLTITIRNTDEILDALYTSMLIDVGGDAELIDETTGEEHEGPIVRSMGDILRGETVVQTYKVMPRVSGPITGCVGAADANINLSVQFVGRGPNCAIGTLPSERLSPDGKPTVTVVPAHNTMDVSVDPPILALFSDRMIEPTITTGYPSATFNVLDPNGAIVPGTLSFTELFEATTAIFRPSAPLAFGTEYSIVVNPSVFNLDGLSLASGMVARFTTEGAAFVPDAAAPQVTLTIEPPLVPNAIGRGQTAAVVADSSDAQGVVRVDLLLNGELIDTKKPNSPVRFLLETGTLEPGSTHELSARAFDAAGNVGVTTLEIQIAPDLAAPAATVSTDAYVMRGRPLAVAVAATDDGRVAKAEVFVDGAAVPAATGLVEPFQFSLPTTALGIGAHALRALVTDGAGNTAEAFATFEVTNDATAPQIVLLSPQGSQFTAGRPVAFAVTATDDNGVETIAFRLDAEVAPRATGNGGFTLDTTGLAPGPHVMTVSATDTSGNGATLPIPFTLIEIPTDTTAPGAVNVAAVTLSPVAAGVLSITGAAGAAEAGARVTITNQTTQAGATAIAAGTGAFSTQIEAAGGDTLRFLATDEAGNVSAAATLVVPVPAVLTSIAVTPASVTLDRSHTSQALTVTGTFSDGSQQVLTAGLSFGSSAPTIASTTASGLVLPGQNGTALVTVSVPAPGVSPVAVPVTVNFTTITGIAALPNPMTLTGLGRSERIAVSALFSDGSSGPFTGSRQFATGNANIAIVDTSGLVTSTGIGTTQVTVASPGLQPTSVLVVVDAVQPSELLVTPNTLAFTATGESQTLGIQFRYTDGTVGSGPFAVTFSSLDDSVAAVTAAGVVSAVGEGTTSIVAQSLSFSVSVSVSVTLPATLPPPEILSLGRPIAGEGDTVAILGRHFAGIPAQNFVTIDGEHADVVGAAFDRLIARVPRGASTGPVQVRVAGQSSNTVDLAIYPRRARTVLASQPFDAPATPGQVVDLGSASFYVHPGDDVLLAGDPNTINGATWTALVAPTFTGNLVVTVNGIEHVFSSASAPIDLGLLLPAVSEPTLVTVAMRVEATGAVLSGRALAIVAGPDTTGAFVGERFLTGDTIGQEITVRFRVNVPDGTKFAAAARAWYRLDGGYHNGSAGGTIVGGVPTPNDGDFRTFTATGGEVAVTYSDAGVFADFGGPQVAVIALVPANAANNRTTHVPVAEARILIGALDSASILPQQVSAVADGVDRPFAVAINSVRDNYGNAILNGTRLALAARPWYRRSDGGYHNGSAGGAISGGVPTPNDGDFRTVELVDGAAQANYSTGGLLFGNGATGTAVLAATVANGANHRVNSRPFAEGTVLVSGHGATNLTATALPSALTASTADSRSIVTVSNLTDAAGHPVPDGARIAVTARTWYRLDGGYHNSSFGGTIVGGDAVPNDGDFRSFVVTGGQVSFTYSNVGLTLDRGATATTVIAILPAAGNGNRIGHVPYAEVRITQAGVTSATIVATPSSTLADGARRPVAVAITNIRDALGTTVPDGTRIALTAQAWYRRNDGGFHNGSAGGTFLDGVATPNDGGFRTFVVTNGRVDATFSAETIAPLSVTDPRSTVVAAVTASAANNNRVAHIPFAEGVIAVSAVATATATVNPATLLADRQGRVATVTITGLTDAQGRPVPDGTNVAITASAWYRLSDGGFHNGSAGGTMLGGTATPNDGSFRTYTVTNGEVTASYSTQGLFVDTGGTAPAILSVLPASPAGNRIGTRPFAITTVTLTGLDTGTFVAPATTSPGGSVSVTLTNIRDAAGNLVPDGTKIAATAVAWYNRDGSFHNGSAGGSIAGGVPTANDGNFRTFTVSGGQVTMTFNAPAAANVTSVISVLSADDANNRNTHRPFATFAIRME